MPTVRLSTQPPADIDFDSVRAELKVPVGYPEDAVAEAVAAAADPPHPELDRTDLPMVTIDPPGAMDLDQAMYLQRNDSGFRVYYAIADVSSFVRPGGALDAETRKRGLTLYSPDGNTPLHPHELSEGAASLLPQVVRPAVLWTIDLDVHGEPTAVSVDRALVRSTAKLDYEGVAADFDAGRPHPSIEPLADIGRLRRAVARSRHAISLDLPDVEVVAEAGGRWTLKLRARNLIEDANAEISLLTGIVAARMMIDGGAGLLRTLPPPGREQVAELRRSAAALGIEWPSGAAAGDIIAKVDAGTGKGAAFLEDAVRLLRGAGYTPILGPAPVQQDHAGVGSPYAHVTAPLRRLADRYATEVCLALHHGRPVPPWAADALPELPALMTAADRRASELEKACTWAVTSFLFADRIGEVFAGTVVQLDVERNRAAVLLDDPPVRARSTVAGLTEGAEVKVKVSGLDQENRMVLVDRVDSE